MPVRKALFDRSSLAFIALSVALLWLRIAALRASTLDLHFDEAQYWAWSRSLEWGYFSKPPLVAWAIAGVTSVFGDPEWAVRLAAPIAQAIAGVFIYALGRSVYGAWAGFWAGAGWLVTPAVWLSSGIISTDALLLAMWSIALFAMWRLIVSRAWTWALLLGLAIGVGALAKYAMLYFFLCAAVAAWWSKPARSVIVNGRGALAALVAIAVLSPNLVWNAQHSFATIGHTASNARLTNNLFHPDELAKFVVDQISLVGPLLLGAFVFLLWRAASRSRGLSDEDRFLLAFITPPLVVISFLALISRANANWAVAAYPAALVWIAGNLAGTKGGARFLAAAAIVNAVLGAAVSAAALNPDFANRIGVANALKRTRGWDETAHLIAARAVARPGQPPYTAVLVDHRALYYELAYYWRHARAAGEPLPPVRMWLLHGTAHNSAEQADPMRPEEGARVLVVHMNRGYVPIVAGDFTVFRSIEHLRIPLGGRINRDLDLSVGEGFAPAPRDAAFERRLQQDEED